MKVNLIIITLTLPMYMIACGGKKKTENNDPGPKTHTLLRDTTKPEPDGDTTHKMVIPDPAQYVNFKSPALKTWIKTNLKGHEGKMDTLAATGLLNLVDIEVITKYRSWTEGHYFQSSRDTNLYIIGLGTYCDSYSELFIAFVINKKQQSIKKFKTWWGRECLGTECIDVGEYEGFTSFGEYYAIEVYHASYGMEDMHYWVINDNLEELIWLPLIHLEMMETEKADVWESYEYGYEHDFRNDTLIEHCSFSASKGEVQREDSLDIFYKCYKDSIVIIDPLLEKKHGEIVTRLGKW